MSQICVLSHSLYNAKDCDDCGRCGRTPEPVHISSLHKFDCSLTTPVKPAVKEHLERIRKRNDK